MTEARQNPCPSPEKVRPPARLRRIPFPDTLALEKNAAALSSASPRGLASLSAGVFLTVRENGIRRARAGGRTFSGDGQGFWQKGDCAAVEKTVY